jgi:predicted nucleic acid-binding protein
MQFEGEALDQATSIGRVPWSDEVSEAFGAIKSELERKSVRIEDFDAAVAAHALAEEGVWVTANLKHLARISAVQVDDWSEELET